MGLRDQLLKAGLINKKQAKKAESGARKQEHDARKNAPSMDKSAAEPERLANQMELEQAQKQERDRRLNREREEARELKEKRLRCLQILKSHRLNEPRASIPYYFVEEGRFVRKVMVSAFQQEALARGRMGIGKSDEEAEPWVIVARSEAVRVRDICPDKVLLLHSEMDDYEQVNEGTGS